FWRDCCNEGRRQRGISDSRSTGAATGARWDEAAIAEARAAFASSTSSGAGCSSSRRFLPKIANAIAIATAGRADERRHEGQGGGAALDAECAEGRGELAPAAAAARRPT